MYIEDLYCYYRFLLCWLVVLDSFSNVNKAEKSKFVFEISIVIRLKKSRAKVRFVLQK